MQEMEALKRAYAEMILNTTKEAAARVLEAELRARRMEQEMNFAKEEAAGLLLRLKQMIDAKTKEAEITSFNQERKCDELESQLNEAEGIIMDLRAELDQAEEQLYEIKNKRMLADIQTGDISEEHNVKPMGPCNAYELLTPSLNLGAESDDVHSGDDCPVLDQIKEPGRFMTTGEKSNPCKNSFDLETANAVATNSVLEGNDEKVKNEDVSIVRRSLRKRKLKFWDDVMAACGKQDPLRVKKPRKAFPCLPRLRTTKAKTREKDGTKIESPDHAEVSKELMDTEALPENKELIGVLVKSDELAAKAELISSSRIECDVAKNHCKYIFSRKWKKKKKSMVYNRKWKKKSVIYPEKSS
ncbi:hypothetical protein ACS0TY_028942 [Phlomoides rotata]